MPILWTGKCSDDAALTPETLVAQGHAVYRDALPCMKALRAAMRYAEFRRQLARPAPQRPVGIDVEAARKMPLQGTLSEAESKKLLELYGLPLTKELVVQNPEAAIHSQIPFKTPSR